MPEERDIALHPDLDDLITKPSTLPASTVTLAGTERTGPGAADRSAAGSCSRAFFRRRHVPLMKHEVEHSVAMPCRDLLTAGIGRAAGAGAGRIGDRSARGPAGYHESACERSPGGANPVLVRGIPFEMVGKLARPSIVAVVS